MRRSVIADNMPVSGIRKMFALASEYENVINLCIGEPDFATPQHIIDAGSYALNHGYTKYVANYRLSLHKKPAQQAIHTIGLSLQCSCPFAGFLQFT